MKEIRVDGQREKRKKESPKEVFTTSKLIKRKKVTLDEL